jgi:hypothetical protein
MLKKYLFFVLLFCAFILPCLFGATVSCLVIETGLPTGGPKSQYSTMWENNLMDVLFETGHIVSNGRMIRLEKMPPENLPAEAERDFQEARQNGMDYFLIAIIEQKSGETPVVSLRLFSASTKLLIIEQVYANNSLRNAREENESIKRAIGLVAAQL